MKKSVFLISALLVAFTGAYAQDDDMYFTPSKTAKAAKEKKDVPLKIQNGTTADDDMDEVYTTEGYNDKNYSDAEVDAYNRRGYKVSGDTLYLGDGEKEAKRSSRYQDDGYYDDDYTYSQRLARFHEPAVNIYFGYGIPWGRWGYGFYDDFWYDPWYYSSWYDPYWSWGWSYYPGYYSWGWGWGWTYPHHHYYYGWGGPGWGWGRPWHSSGWNGGRYLAGGTDYRRVGSAGGRIWGGGRNYRNSIESNGTGGYSRYSTGSIATRRSGAYSRSGSYGRSSTTYSRPSTTTRSYGSRSYGSGSVSTRSFGGGSSVGSSSRSFGGGGSSPSMGTRSFGGGGGGGGRSFGGGRR